MVLLFNRHLAQISRSTRGIVLLLCDLDTSRRIMSEAKRLNMIGGHFIWLWADTTSTTEFFDIIYSNDLSNPESDIDLLQMPSANNGDKKFNLFQHEEFSINEDDNIVKMKHTDTNDSNEPNEELISNNNKRKRSITHTSSSTVGLGSVSSSNKNAQQQHIIQQKMPFLNFSTSSVSHVLFHHFQDFPIGLLALRPVRMKIDRHFIRSAIRLFSSIWIKVELEALKQQPSSSWSSSSSNTSHRNRNNKRIKRFNSNIYNNIDEVNKSNKNLTQSDLLFYPSIFSSLDSITSSTDIISVLNQNKSGLDINYSNNNKLNLIDNNFNTINQNNNNKTSNSKKNSSSKLNSGNKINSNNKSNIIINNSKSKIVKRSKSKISPWNYNPTNNQERKYRMRNKDKQSREGIGSGSGKKTPHYRGGCYGTPSRDDILRAENFAM